MRRKCSATVVVRVVGTRPASSFRRPCKRWASPGSRYCGHHAAECETCNGSGLDATGDTSSTCPDCTP